MGYVVTTAVIALIVGFVVGLTTFKRSSRWCPACGSILRCVSCPNRPAPFEIRKAGTNTQEMKRR
ncbi:hypothetical protein GCM10009835_16970 [Planosporangium flavigriseum]